MPAVFFGHGSPMNALERNRYTDAWAAIARAMPVPRAVLAISAHWYGPALRVTAQERPPTIHDFGGFPAALHALEYPAAGDPELAARVRDLLAPVPVALDGSWGLDHGVWSVLIHAFPAADVPVVQLSLDASLTPAEHVALARRLGPLRDEGVLVMASGNVVHNLAALDFAPGRPPHDWATRYSALVRGALAAGDLATLAAYPQPGGDARLAAPDVEHYLPVLYPAALRRPDESVSFPVDGIDGRAIGMLTAVVGGAAGGA